MDIASSRFLAFIYTDFCRADRIRPLSSRWLPYWFAGKVTITNAMNLGPSTNSEALLQRCETPANSIFWNILRIWRVGRLLQPGVAGPWMRVFCTDFPCLEKEHIWTERGSKLGFPKNPHFSNWEASLVYGDPNGILLDYRATDWPIMIDPFHCLQMGGFQRHLIVYPFRA